MEHDSPADVMIIQLKCSLSQYPYNAKDNRFNSIERGMISMLTASLPAHPEFISQISYRDDVTAVINLYLEQLNALVCVVKDRKEYADYLNSIDDLHTELARLYSQVIQNNHSQKNRKKINSQHSVN